MPPSHVHEVTTVRTSVVTVDGRQSCRQRPMAVVSAGPLGRQRLAVRVDRRKLSNYAVKRVSTTAARVTMSMGPPCSPCTSDTG